ncbi:MAG: hypothetical protein KC419_10145 [Anaerolineales bacterium]|nr:hypothetical protein [Anaerolineales bacterium]MCA9928829.1 hypothetical protein [Anaerolineales bacterium]
MFEQERIIVRLQQRVMADPEIAVCFLSGSYGRRREDGYSDLDVALVFSGEEQRDAAWHHRRAFVHSVTPYVPSKSFDAVHIRPFFHIALYSNGSKVDYRFETQTDLQPNPWDRDIRILKDDQGWVEQFQAASARVLIPQPRITSEELAALDERFWVMFWDAFRLLLRGDHDKPFTVYLELMHFTLSALLRVLPPEEPTRQALLAARFDSDTKATAVHMKQLLDAYLGARTAVIRRLHLDFIPDIRFENQIMQVMQRKL